MVSGSSVTGFVASGSAFRVRVGRLPPFSLSPKSSRLESQDVSPVHGSYFGLNLQSCSNDVVYFYVDINCICICIFIYILLL